MAEVIFKLYGTIFTAVAQTWSWCSQRVDKKKWSGGDNHHTMFRGGSRAAATSKMECFVIIVNDFQPLTITKRSILDVAAGLDPLLMVPDYFGVIFKKRCVKLVVKSGKM